MALVCLPPAVADKIKTSLIKGEIDPVKLENMTSEERHNFLAKHVGEENAKFVNSNFETKLLLKNKQQGYITWARHLTGIAPEVKRDLISRINRLDERILNPETEKSFLKDLAETKLGVGVTHDEAKTIADMSAKLKDLEAKRSPDGTFPSEKDRMAYGYAKNDLGNYIGTLKLHAERPSLGHMIKNPGETTKETILHPIKASSRIAGTAKSVKAAFDDSALFRQGWKTLITHPNIWRKNVQKNIGDLVKQGIKNQDIMREANADVLSRPNAKYYEKMGISPKVEEEFGDPTLVTKIPIAGRLYKTTEGAFNAFMLRNRADLADFYLKVAKENGVNIDDPKELKPIGRMIGGLTGRGDLGRFEGSAASNFNNIFFSPRFVKSQLDTVLHPITGAGGSNFVRKEAAKNLVKMVGATAAIFATANALKPGSVELDPRSSNFGKIKVGDTTFDLTGGFGSIATLAARLYTQQSKSSHGLITKLGDNPTSPTGQDLVMQFITGKLSPAAQRVWVNLVTHQEYNGAAPTAKSNLANLFEPLPVNTYTEAKQDPHSANAIVTEVADALGISANTNNPAQRVKQNLSATDQGFKDKFGAKAYNDFNQQYNDRLTTFTESSFYRNLPPDEKQIALTRAEDRIKKSIYKKYNYTPPKSKSNKAINSAVDAVVK